LRSSDKTKDLLLCFKAALNNVILTFSYMASSKTRTQMIIGTSIVGIFAALILGVYRYFNPARVALTIRVMPLARRASQ
jgi:hypothetical protein